MKRDYVRSKPFRITPMVLGVLSLFPLLTTQAMDRKVEPLPAVSIIIDDMGNQPAMGALNLPGKVTYAFLPHTPHAARLAEEAHQRGKQVLLHLPMASHDGADPGPGALTLHMTETAFKTTLLESLRAVPHVVGLNNHMGSLLTRHPGAMTWVMETLTRRRELFFIDSRTTPETVAQRTAREYGVPNTRRDVFLDNQREPEAIRSQFRLLLAKARKQGYAVGIGHPYPETIDILKSELADLERQSIRLIPISELIALQQRRNPWPAPSSHSPKVVKNSKPSPLSICCAEPVSK